MNVDMNEVRDEVMFWSKTETRRSHRDQDQDRDRILLRSRVDDRPGSSPVMNHLVKRGQVAPRKG